MGRSGWRAGRSLSNEQKDVELEFAFDGACRYQNPFPHRPTFVKRPSLLPDLSATTT